MDKSGCFTVITSPFILGTSVTTTTMTSTVGTVQPKVPNFRDLSTTLLRMRMDFEQQEKQFLDEVDDLNTFDVVLRKAQDKVVRIIFCLSTKFLVSQEF